MDGRRVGVGMDYSTTSTEALQWAVDNLVGAGDFIILIHVLPSNSNSSQRPLWENSGSPLIPLNEFREQGTWKQYGVKPTPEVLSVLETASSTKKVNVLSKIYWGDAREKMCDAVSDLRLHSLVVGSRGLGAVKRVLLGSVSNYVVANASCPVTVVKGSAKPP